MHSNHIETVIEVVSKRTLGNKIFQVLVRRRDNTYVNFDRAMTTDSIKFVFCQDSKESRLCSGGHVSYLV